MNVMIVTDGGYYRAPDGNVYVDSVYDYDFYKRYLLSFNNINVVARMEEIDYVPTDKKIASGDNINFWELPNYKGLKQFILNYPTILKYAKKYSELADCAIFRLPSNSANTICRYFSKTGKPFSIEVVVDPWLYFSKGTLKSKFRPVVRVVWTRFLKQMCLTANGVSYVTEKYLQKYYPSVATKNGNSEYYFTSHYSTIDLKEDSILSVKNYPEEEDYVITHVSNLFAGYSKGHLPLIDTLKILIDKGYNFRVQFIGDGPLKENYFEYAKNLGIDKNIEFLGKLANGNEVRKIISNSHFFVFPTKAEGLPRVILEAMSVGLPCISTPICGIPEILSEEFLFEYNDSEGMAEKLISLVENPSEYQRASEINIETIYNYTSKVLNIRRKEFYDKLKCLTIKLGGN